MREYQKKYEIMHGYKTNEKEDEPFYKLIEAIEKNDEKSVQDLIDKKIELNVYLWNNEIHKYETPLIVSIRKGYDAITMLLLENGAKVNLNSVLGDYYRRTTALGMAVLTGNYKMTENLIKRNVNLNEYVPPVLIAIKKAQNSENEEDKNKYYEIAKLLIESGAKLENWCGISTLEEASKLDRELGCNDLSVEINKKEKEKEDRRKKLREEYIIKTKEYIQKDDELKSKFEDKTIELYTDLKMGTLSNIVELDGEELDDLLLLTNYKKQKLKVVSKTYEITKQDIKDLECKAPIYIRMVEGEKPSYKHNETGVELEIRKLLRSNFGEETLSRLESTKTGNKGRCFSMVNFGRVCLFGGKEFFIRQKGRCGYGVIKGNIKNLKQMSLQENMNSIDYLYAASDRDLASRYEKDSDVVSTKRATCDAVNKRILTIFDDLKNSKGAEDHNEFIMDVAHEDVKFVCWCNPKEDCNKLMAVYFRKKFLEKTGRTLPIFQYELGQEDYLEETNFSKEEIKDMLKKEVLDSEGKQLKVEYNTIKGLYFFMAFKDEIKEIDGFDIIVKQFIDNKIDELLSKQYIVNVYDIVNIIKYGEIIKDEVYQQECIKKIFKELDFQRVIFDSIMWYSKERAKMLIIEAISEIRILAKGDTVDFLMPKLIDGVNKSMVLIELGAAVYAKNSNLIDKILKENLDESFPLIYALWKEGNERIIQLFIDKGIDLNKEYKVNGEQITPVMYAFKEGNERIIRVLIDKGIDLNKECEVDGEQITPVMYALKKKDKEIIKLFIDKKDKEIIKLLIDKKDKEIMQLLIDKKDEEIIQLLIDKKDEEIIQLFIDKRDEKIIKFLIDNGDEKIKLLIGKELLAGVKIRIKKDKNNKKEYLAMINKALENDTVRNLLKEGKIKIIDLLDNKIVLREKPEESYKRYVIDKNLELKWIKKKKRTGFSRLMCIYRAPKKLIRRLYRKYTMEYVSYDYLGENNQDKSNKEILKLSREFLAQNGRKETNRIKSVSK